MSPSDSRAGRTPLATYRLQFNHQFGFEQACELVPYLHELGISDTYASPLFLARPESLHGYDVCDFTRLNLALGSREAFDEFSARLTRLGMGLLLDMVPNHMGADLCNPWWLDVLRNGRASAYAEWFDIDWQAPGCEGKVLLPLLEDHYGNVLAAGMLRLGFDAEELAIVYYERHFPVCSNTYVEILEEVLAWCSLEGRPNQLLHELHDLLRGFQNLEKTTGSCDASFRKLKFHFAELVQHSAELRDDLTALLESVNGTAGVPSSFDRLHGILRQQHYRLADWRIGSEAINYRRFFDVSDLVSLCMEREEVFEATHRLVLELIKEGKLSALRIDHPDGLWNPRQYLERLRAAAAAPLYVVVEKILTGEEMLRPDWAVDGTTGYDFLNRLNGLFVDIDHGQAFDAVYRKFTECRFDFDDLVYDRKKQVLLSSFIGELNSLTRRLQGLASATRIGQDFSTSELQAGLIEVIASFPVYRTYVEEQTAKVLQPDRDYIIEAINSALTRVPALDRMVTRFLEQVLLLEPLPDFGEAENQSRQDFVMRFQQLTSPVMAKGLEDTAFYNFNRLLSLNEVGGNPGRFGTDIQKFHAYNSSQCGHWPNSLLTTATHDTKRGEDARARINVLSEMPQAWEDALACWSNFTTEKKQTVDGATAPHPNDEYLFYQALLGAWPPDAEVSENLQQLRDRLSAYMLKAVRESKTRSNWTNPNRAYEHALHGFIEQLLDPSSDNRFLEAFKPFQRRIAFFGQFNSLSQTLLKMTSPGVPDFYQGTELWDFNLVDPDNRRPVEYSLRRRLLAELKQRFGQLGPEPGGSWIELLDPHNAGASKLFLIWRTLQFRHHHTALFQHGQYLPLSAIGPKQKHVCAFARRLGGQTVIVVVPRLVVGLVDGTQRPPMGNEVWKETMLQLPDGDRQYQNVLTGGRHIVSERGNGLLVGEVLKDLPVGLLANI